MRPMTALAVQSVRSLADRAQALNAAYASWSARDLLGSVIHEEFPGRVALVSSFGIEAAVLLHLVASVDPATPVIFLDTGKLFGETLRYRDELIRRLGLRDVRTFVPDASDIAAEDPDGGLWDADPDRCCFIRKVLPLQRALTGFDAWINGRKGHHGGRREGLPKIEAAGGRIKVNALAAWTPADIAAYFAAADLPRHPLEADGFSSIGCMPCSSRTAPGEAARAGRWRGTGKTECGIHLDAANAAPRGE
jgi:phosphoadenosine phosphosulfate reductase